MKLPQLPADKANHVIYGAALAAGSALFVPPGVAVALVVVAAFIKEAAFGEPDALDFLATLGGGALVLAPLAMGA